MVYFNENYVYLPINFISFFVYSPSSTCYEDTYNTLKYADRAKNIKSDLKSNVISVDFHVSKYAKIVEELKQQVRYEKDEICSLCDFAKVSQQYTFFYKKVF